MSSARSRTTAELDATRELLAADDTRLRPTSDLAVARATLARHRPASAEQLAMRERMLAFVESHPTDAHQRALRVGHLTASALIVDRARGKGLLTFHRKLERWLQLGGHCDGDANLAGVALREAFEESGIEGLRIDPAPIDVDIHAIPARPGEPEHLHYDTRFLVIAPSGATAVVSDESHALEWFSIEQLDELAGDPRAASDPSVRRLFELVWR